MKKLFLIVFLLTLVFSLVACINGSTNGNVDTTAPDTTYSSTDRSNRPASSYDPTVPIDLEGTGLVEITLPVESNPTVISLLDDSIIFWSYSNAGAGSYNAMRQATFFRYYYESGRLVVLGSLYVVRDRVNHRWGDGVLFIYPPISSTGGGNDLAGIDTETNTLSRYAIHPTSNPWNAFLSPLGGNVLLLKSKTDRQASYISIYDRATGSSETVLDASAGLAAQAEVEYQAIDTCNDYVYVLGNTRQTTGADMVTAISVYDGNFNFIKDIAMGEIGHVTDIMDFRVFGQYVYLRSDAYGSAIIAKIEEGDYLTVLRHSVGDSINFVNNTDETMNTQIFFEPHSKKVIFLNTETGSLTEALLPFPDIGYIAEYTLSLTANGDAVLIILTPLGAEFGGRCRMFMTHLSFADFG